MKATPSLTLLSQLYVFAPPPVNVTDVPSQTELAETAPVGISIPEFDGLITEISEAELVYGVNVIRPDLLANFDLSRFSQTGMDDFDAEVETGLAIGDIISNIDPFVQSVASTWPRPEITSLNFQEDANGQLEKIHVKIKISGNFLDDEWFWADMLEHFKLKVTLIPNVSEVNDQIYDISLFEETTTDGSISNYQYFLPLGEPISSMKRSAEGLSNEYIMESTIDLKKKEQSTVLNQSINSAGLDSINLGAYNFAESSSEDSTIALSGVSAIVARTFLDKKDMKRAFFANSLEDEAILPQLTPGINGKWDFIEFEINEDGKVISSDRYYSILANTNVLWNCAFDYSLEQEQYLATDNHTAYPKSPVVVFNRQRFTKSNWPLLLISKQIKTNFKKDKDVSKEKLNPNKELKFKDDINLNTAFSDAYIAKNSDGEVEVAFSFDYLELFKQLSAIPDQIYNNIQENVGGNITRNIQIIDKDGKFLTDGIYQYLVDFRVENRIDMYVSDNLNVLAEAERKISAFLKEVQKEQSEFDGEFSFEFLDFSQFNFEIELEEAINGIYDVLTDNLLNYFLIKRFVLKRRRIKNALNKVEFKNIDSPDIQISRADESEGFPLEFTDAPDVFTEFDTRDLSFDFSVNYDLTREDALMYARPENMSIDNVLLLQEVVNQLKQELLSLIREEHTQEALSLIKTGRKNNTDVIVDNTVSLNGLYEPKDISVGFSFGDVNNIDINVGSDTSITGDIKYSAQQSTGENPDIDTYVRKNINNADQAALVLSSNKNVKVGNVMVTNLSLKYGLDFEFLEASLSDVISEETTDKKAAEFNSSDLDDKNNIVNEADDIYQKSLDDPSVKIMLDQLSDNQAGATDVSVKYLAGYETDSDGKSIMKRPIFVSTSNLTEDDRGRKLLFKVDKAEKDTNLSIYNEYFVKEV